MPQRPSDTDRHDDDDDDDDDEDPSNAKVLSLQCIKSTIISELSDETQQRRRLSDWLISSVILRAGNNGKARGSFGGVG